MKKNILFCIICLFLNCTFINAQSIKIACIGNSITYGSRITDRDKDSYPAILNRLLGTDYQVENFGLSGRTLSRDAGRPYILESRYQEALAYTPDIVIIKLGTNDTQPRHWTSEESIKSSLNELIDSFLAINNETKIYLCLPVPAFGENNYTIDPEKVAGPIQQWISEVAHERKLPLIDLYTPLKNQDEYFPDLVHPNEAGASMIAEEVYKSITK